MAAADQNSGENGDNKRRLYSMVCDDYEGQSEKHKSQKTKEGRMTEQERHTYGFIQPNYGMKFSFDLYDIGLSKDEIATVHYCRNVHSSAEIVIMNCEIGRLTLTGDDMNSLIRPTNETGPFKWINDKVFFPINLHNQHWYVGVLNLGLKQFQILDSKAKHSSLYTELTLNLVQAELFRKQLVYQLIFSEKNILTNVQDDIRKMVQT
ncbi:Ulp1 protease family, C-terminal catalytic domain-containing protein [Carex littledalei]|uniref:Ulp1 protease family, C-terminal catalytic domain-containing protein n=1 Tax=Carex littledalei TaxID=544730 RepID=A0A833VT59_9POAL|nr:Ulp1 protease family, C-terminal catalytic domain-containing protein [Carex littledalei]